MFLPFQSSQNLRPFLNPSFLSLSLQNSTELFILLQDITIYIKHSILPISNVKEHGHFMTNLFINSEFISRRLLRCVIWRIFYFIVMVGKIQMNKAWTLVRNFSRSFPQGVWEHAKVWSIILGLGAKNVSSFIWNDKHGRSTRANYNDNQKSDWETLLYCHIKKTQTQLSLHWVLHTNKCTKCISYINLKLYTLKHFHCSYMFR
jgi:hypothetical protein